MRSALTTIFSLLLAYMPVQGQYATPPASAPGVVDTSITQSNIATTICVPNYTATVRPPVSWTNRLKVSLMAQFHLTGAMNGYELDHRVPIEVGGAPRDARNLWMQPWPEARLKDRLETFKHRQVCAGKVTLRQSQEVFLKDFWAEYDRLAPAQGWPVR